MSRQTIAQDWKTIETTYDQLTSKFKIVKKNAGHFTQSTIAKKVGRIAGSKKFSLSSKIASRIWWVLGQRKRGHY